MHKKLLLLVAASLLSLAGFTQNKSFTIKGSLQHISPQPIRVYLSEVGTAGILKKNLDSAEVRNGTYEFKGELNADNAIGAVITDNRKAVNPNNNLTFIIDAGDFNIISEGTISNATISGTGSIAQHQFDDMRKATKLVTDTIKRMAGAADFKTNKELQAEVQKKSMGILGKSIFDMYTYVKQNPDARVSPYVTYMLIQLPFLSETGKDTLVRLIPEKSRDTKLGKTIIQTMSRNKVVRDSLTKVEIAKQAENMSKIAIGSKALDLTQHDSANHPISLSSLKGKYVLVDFWASWCAPCRAENPNVVKAYHKYKDKGFTVMGVSLDGKSTQAAWLKAIKTDGLEWTQVSDLSGWSNGAAKLYDVKSIPQNFLIDPNGIVIGKNLRGEELNAKLATIFK
jgi:peroxiredoxin